MPAQPIREVGAGLLWAGKSSCITALGSPRGSQPDES